MLPEEDQKKLDFLLGNVEHAAPDASQEDLNDQFQAEQIDSSKQGEILTEIIDMESPSERQESLNARIKKAFPDKSAEPSKTKETEKDELKGHMHDIAGMESPEDQIQRIVDIAQKLGPEKALEMARHIQNNFVLDEVHGDLLEDVVHQKLVEAGLLKE